MATVGQHRASPPGARLSSAISMDTLLGEALVLVIFFVLGCLLFWLGCQPLLVCFRRKANGLEAARGLL